MSIKMPTLANCPLCGGKPRYVKENVYMAPAYRVECTCCHISTDYSLVGINGMVGNTIISLWSPAVAKHNAGIKWNKLPIHRTSCLSTAEHMTLCKNPINVREFLVKKGGV